MGMGHRNCSLGRQFAAPEIGDVLAVIELDGDAQIVVGRERVFRDLGRKLLHAPSPSELRAGLQRHEAILFHDPEIISAFLAVFEEDPRQPKVEAMLDRLFPLRSGLCDRPAHL